MVVGILSELRESHRYMSKSSHRIPDVAIGVIVIVHDDCLPRGHWKLGEVQDIYKGCDGLPRSAMVRVTARNSQHTSLKSTLPCIHSKFISK